MKFKFLIVFALLLFSVALHEAVHVIQYYFLYGDSIVSFNFVLFGGYISGIGIPHILSTVVTVPAEIVNNTINPYLKWAIMEIPAYAMMFFLWIVGFKSVTSGGAHEV